ncbi:2-hydroxycarboxylate transporter family protein [Fructobacillus sp. M1-13]|uniref:2-hydroxycarboxylate transporter family protein n=1 Tax=Fructobacillus papyriferae TaxID=2713171 RepID=A0ABS5QQE9_9LACO|nr:2-hydroxycarboxylate transporter family protein [Fructobacillus papyriferae]MBS9334559.1 2-hydroxycarboxylate transporter family protein [Fructobacillus papyriferae]MCD2158548.1 2-hydroxycarboxylate transporter family protein [Fructobacillus papyriferae]
MSEQTSEKGLFAKIEEKVQVTHIGGVAFVLMLLLLVAVLGLNAMPKNMGGALFALVILGGVFFFVGNNTPILKSYLGGGSALAVVAGSAFTAMGLVPHTAVANIKTFISDNNFLEFYIVALICSAILKMDRDLLLKSAVRFLPVAFGAMIIAFIVTSLVGMSLGYDFKHAALYISFPMMAGGIGAGIVPLSASYAGALHQSAGDILNQLFPAVVIANLLAIIGSSLLVKFTTKSKMNGQGELLKATGGMEVKKTEMPAINNRQLMNGMMVALSFYMMGNVLYHFVPKINAFAFMILLVILAKGFNLVPKFYEESAAMFGNMITYATTPALLAGIGLALVDMNKLLQTVTWQLVLCSFVSVITIGIAGGFLGKLFGLYPVESAIAGGMINNSMGGTGNVAVLSASNRMGLIAFAQMGNRIGGAIILILGGLLITIL